MATASSWSRRSARRSSSCCGLVQRVYGDFGLKYPIEALDAAARVPGHHRDVEPRRSRAQAALDACRQALHDQRGRRRVLRPEDRLRRHRRDRPEVAVRHDSARLPDPGAVRPEIRRRGQRGTSAGRHPSCHFRQLRAVHRAPDRALRRGVAAVAGPGSGRRPADFRPPPGLCGRRPRPAGRGRAAGRTGRPRRRRLVIRSERPSCRRSRTCW